MTFDFSGYATKNNVKCSDGRTIRKDAFKHNDGQQVPLVWQHLHNDPGNILGHAMLENREDGVYAYGKFNNTEAGQNAKALVLHGDINFLSIYANRLKQRGSDVLHGEIREVSLVLTGANPGAKIDNLNIAHMDGSIDVDDTEAIIYSGVELKHQEEEVTLDQILEESLEHTDEVTLDDILGAGLEHADDETVQEVFDSLTDVQKNVVYAMLGQALEESTTNIEHSDEGGTQMKMNVFERHLDQGNYLSHADGIGIIEMGKQLGSLKEAWLMHEDENGGAPDPIDPGTGDNGAGAPENARYGIENIDYLFPDARLVNQHPKFIQREMGWVSRVLAGTHHTPFSRIKTTAADITADEARAKGYVKGNRKKEEVISLLKRVTTPQTIYKKQKLDRDDIIDITDMNVVVWLKAEMRMMLDEELARAVLVGDGRSAESEDKIKAEHIRPIYLDDELYTHRVQIAKNRDIKDIIDDMIRAREHYKGTGNPNLFTTTAHLMNMLLVKDTLGRRLYNTKAELASALLVNDIIEVPVMADLEYENAESAKFDLLGIMVNLKDYNIGADKGGAVNLFDDFDIDFNQYKYLIETRCSGALTIPKAAVVFERSQATPAE